MVKIINLNTNDMLYFKTAYSAKDKVPSLFLLQHEVQPRADMSLPQFLFYVQANTT